MNDETRTRLESKFIITPSCWIWTAYTTIGYGKFSIKDRMRGAHRVSYELYVGPIPAGMHVLHRCDNRRCVNPDHLFLGTNADNMEDKIKKNRQQKGTAFKTAKLDEQKILDIRNDPRPHRVIARHYGIARSAVSEIKLFKRWRHVTAAQSASGDTK